MTLPPTAARLLADLHAAGGSLPYRDPRVTTSGLTWLRHRGLAGVTPSRSGTPARVELTDAGRSTTASLVTP